MYNIRWDPETNGVLLTSEQGDVQSSVRPVFFEELDLLGFDSRGFRYPRVEEPLLWAAGRAYYYRGEKIAVTHGGGFYEDIDLEILTEIRELKPVNLDEILKRNIDKINFYTHDSINFIHSTVLKYKGKVDIVTVSFSGGKDSVVISDLVKRTLSSTDFVVIFADTQLESKMTYDFIDQYIHENPTIQFIIARLGRSQTELWSEFGPPSRINRWCHTVYKTAPIRKRIKEYLGKEKPTMLLIDGIRAEESARRSKYDNIQFGTKEMLQINVSPILEWSSAEVFLYMFLRKLSFNQMYRCGYSRVGCIICPYSSSWGEYLSRTLFEDDIDPYLNIIKKNVENSQIPDIHNYISEGRWKSRSGGLDLEHGGNRSEFLIDNADLTILANRSNPEFWTWLKVLGPVVKHKNYGEIKYEDEIYPITQIPRKNGVKYIIKGAANNIKFINLIKKLSYKSQYCVACQACEAVCPTSALTISGGLKIDADRCINCFNCTNYVEKGCWVAKSISHVGFQKVKMMTGKGMNRYQGFGLEKKWVSYFLEGEEWENERSSHLGNCQISGFKNWLKDARLFDKKPTELAEQFIELSNVNDIFMWAVIWSNLSENSPLINWYTLHVPEGSHSKNELVNLIATFRGQDTPNRTDINAVNSLIGTLTKSPIGDILNQGFESKTGKEKIYSKGVPQEIPDLAILYTIYQYAARNERRRLVVSEFIKNREVTPHWIFNLEYNAIKAALVRLASKHSDLVHIEFSGNLDNVNLSESETSIDVVKRYITDVHR